VVSLYTVNGVSKRQLLGAIGNSGNGKWKWLKLDANEC